MKFSHYLYVIFVLCFVTCTQNHNQEHKKEIIRATLGIRIDADTIQKPTSKKIGELKPSQKPLVKKSEVSFTNYSTGHFTNYGTEQGLALSTIFCSCVDREGNLWFGSAGGGVSKFDGKSFTNYTNHDGLVGNAILSIFEDSYGNIWFGTDGSGVSKYDGVTFKNFTTKEGLTDNKVGSICEDKLGNIWFGTYFGGLCKYDGNRVDAILKGNSSNVLNQHDIKKVDGKPVSSFTDRNDIYDGAKHCTQSILSDSKGNIWFGAYGQGVYKYDGKKAINFKFKDTLGMGGNVIKEIYEDKKGNIWFGTYSNGVFKCNKDQIDHVENNVSQFTHYSKNEGLADSRIESILEDNVGNMWFGTVGNGVSKFDGKTFETINNENGLPGNSVFAITKDNTGNMWFSMEAGGVSMYDESFGFFKTLNHSESAIILSISEDKKGNLWFGTYGQGLFSHNINVRNFQNIADKKNTEVNLNNLFAHYIIETNVAMSVYTDNEDNQWIGLFGKLLSKMTGNLCYDFNSTNALKGLTNFSTFQDKNGHYWFGTDHGISKYDGINVTNFGSKNGYFLSQTWDIEQAKDGSMWFANNGGGLYQYDGSFFTKYTKEVGLLSNNGFCVVEDLNGDIWFGSEGGLNRLHFLSNTKSITDSVQIINYTTFNGLPDNAVTQIVKLPGGKLALGTNNGIAIFNPNLPLDKGNRLAELEIFNSTTGYPIKDVNVGYNCLYLDSKNVLWAGTGDSKVGLIRLDYTKVKKNLKSPNVKIENIKINERDVCYYSLNSQTDSTTLSQNEIRTYNKILTIQERDSLQRFYNGVSFDSIVNFYHVPYNLVLPYRHNNLTIEFNCIEVGRHFMVNYQFMLEGYDQNWRPITKEQKATYGNIDEGTYIFKLKAQSPDGIWSEPITYVFKVLPPWYRTWWMYLIYIISSLSVLFLFFKWRTAALKERQKQLEQTVKERTAEVVEQKHLIEEKHKEITDSINYAERIQRALLASQKLLNENLKDYFILFKPKDIVSGDFYWATELTNGHFAILTADSTGHGVPGAIMSILNISCIDKAVTMGMTNPDIILNETRRLIINHLKNDGSQDGGKDGMDGSLLCFDFTKNILYCASANNPIWIVRTSAGSATKEIVEIKADRMPIGKHEKDQTPFTLQTFQLEKGDIVYSLTDGFADQFGGSNGKKYKYKPLQELLLSMKDDSMEIQKQTLSDAFDKWKGNLEQVDDVCLIGIRI